MHISCTTIITSRCYSCLKPQAPIYTHHTAHAALHVYSVYAIFTIRTSTFALHSSHAQTPLRKANASHHMSGHRVHRKRYPGTHSSSYERRPSHSTLLMANVALLLHETPSTAFLPRSPSTDMRSATATPVTTSNTLNHTQTRQLRIRAHARRHRSEHRS